MSVSQMMADRREIEKYNEGKMFRVSLAGEPASCVYDFEAMLNISGMDVMYFDYTFVKAEFTFTTGTFVIERI